jgi:hypothetical protein
MSNQRVKIYDFKTQQMTEIPAQELAPNMILFELPNGERVFIEADTELPKGPLHPLPQGYADIARTVLQLLPSSIGTEEHFLNEMLTDSHPVGELKIWMQVAAVVHEFASRAKGEYEAAAGMVLHVALAHVNNGEYARHLVDSTNVDPRLTEAILRRMRAYTTTDHREFWSSRIDLAAFERMEREEAQRHAPK